MNRNRFISPTPMFNIENQINPSIYNNPLMRFNTWQQPMPIAQNMQPPYILPQPKKNYCSTCDLWTVDSFTTHQSSVIHLTKKSIQRINSLNYGTSYPSTVNNNSNVTSNNVSINSTSNSNVGKRSNRRRSRRNKPNTNNKIPSLTEVTTQREINLDDNDNSLSPKEEIGENLGQSSCIDSQSQLSDDNKITSPLKNKCRGQEMLIPVNGMFCALCELFFPNKDIAETEHCRSATHCEAYEKLLKKVQNSKNEKRKSPESPENVNISDTKRVKVSEKRDRDFRNLPPPSEVTKYESRVDSSLRVSEELDQNSTNEFNAPDFSLEFPDEFEDYDENEIASNNCRMYPSSENQQELSTVSKDV